MKLIIDIPEEDYIRLKDEGMFGNVTTFKRAVREGIPLEECSDCISRQAAVDGADVIIARDTSGNNDVVKAMTACKSYVEGLPPVTPAEKVGRWIAQDIHNCHTDFRCSKCGYIHDFMHLYGKPTADYTYCSKCGAKMQEVKE